MTAKGSKYYLACLNNLVDHTIILIIIVLIKNLLMLIILLWLKNLRQILKLLSLKLIIESELPSIRIFFSKGYTGNWSREIFILDSILETNRWTYEINNLNGKKIIGSIYEKELLRSILKMRYYPEPESHIRNKWK